MPHKSVKTKHEKIQWEFKVTSFFFFLYKWIDLSDNIEDWVFVQITLNEMKHMYKKETNPSPIQYYHFKKHFSHGNVHFSMYRMIMLHEFFRLNFQY